MPAIRAFFPKLKALFFQFQKNGRGKPPLLSPSSYKSVTWLRSSSICLDGYGSKIRKVSRCRPAASNEINLATRQEFHFTKVAPVQSIIDIVLLDFLLILLSWMFISCYATIYFFVKNFIFSNVCFNECDIIMSLYVFWLRKGQSVAAL